MDDPVLQTVPLGRQWGTADPFLFCVHHLDRYPAANEHMGPAASLEARDLGMDFSGAEGWSMYHGSIVPGFPQHPHRGFETVTYVRQGLIDHSDSLGATARFGRGDVQWLTAGSGIVHCEMFPLIDRTGPEHHRAVPDLAQPARRRQDGRPVLHHAVGRGDPPVGPCRRRGSPGRADRHRRVRSRASGRWPPRRTRTRRVPTPTWPSGISCSSRSPGGWSLRPDRPETTRTLYVFEGTLSVAGHTVEASTGVVVRPDEPVTVAAGPDGAEVLVLQGRPIGEPVAQYGPFVMNDRAGIEQALVDYQTTGFGGWPWPTDDPVQPREAGRFARHADGRLEERPAPEVGDPGLTQPPDPTGRRRSGSGSEVAGVRPELADDGVEAARGRSSSSTPSPNDTWLTAVVARMAS